MGKKSQPKSKSKGKMDAIEMLSPSKPEEPRSSSDPRRLERRDTDEQIRVVKVSKFSDFTNDQIYDKVVGGKTLHQRLVDHKSAGKTINRAKGKAKKAVRFGPKIIQKLRRMYGKDGNSGGEAESTAVAKDVIQSEFWRVMKIACNLDMGKRNRSELYTYLEAEPNMTQHEFKVLLKSCAGLDVAGSPTQRDHVILLMKYIGRLDLQKKYPDVWQEGNHVFDCALKEDFAATLKKKKPVDWWKLHCEIGRLIIENKEAVDNLFAHEARKDITGMTQELPRVGSSELAKTLFGASRRLLTSLTFSEKVDTKLRDLRDDTATTWEQYTSAKDDLQAEAQRSMEIFEEGEVIEPRPLYIHFCGFEFPLAINNYNHEFVCKWTMEKKSLAEGRKNGLPSWPFMSEFLPAGVGDKVCVVPAAALMDYKKGREEALNLIRGAEDTSAKDIHATLLKAIGELQKSDPTIYMDIAFFKWLATDEAGEKLISDRTNSILPTSNRHSSLKEVRRQIEAIKDSKLYGVISAGQRGKFDSIVDAVLDFEKGVLEDKAFKAATGLKKEVLNSLIWSEMFEEAKDSKSDPTKFYGVQGLKKRWALVKSQGADAAAADSQSIAVYRFWLSAADLKEYKAFADSKFCTSAASSVAASVASGAIKKAKKPKLKHPNDATEDAADATDEMLLNLFAAD